MRKISLVFLGILFFSTLLPAEDVKAVSVDQIAGIIDTSEREETLRKRISDISSLDGRLLFLEDAAQYESLRKTANEIRKELLLLSGRTEEAEDLVRESGVLQSELEVRLAINHGKIPLSRDKVSARIPGLDLTSLNELSENNAVSPEYYALRRGAIFSAAFLLSPESADFSDSSDSIVQQNQDSSGLETSDQGTIAIQVGAFSREQNAMDHIDYLAGRGINAELLTQVRQDGTSVYKTVIPGIPDSDAQRKLILLKEKGIEGFILR